MNATDDKGDHTTPSPEPLHRADAAALLVCVLGFIPRIAEFVRGRNLWSDEAILAWNAVVRIDPSQQPIAEAMAPPGFMGVLAAGISLYGPYEQAVRALPFIAGLAVLPLTYLVARRLFSPAAALPALAFAAFTQPLIVYSNEVRPYAVDAALVLLLIFLGWPALKYPLHRGKAVTLALIGAAAIWLSFPSVYAMAAVGIALLWAQRKAGRRSLTFVGAIGAVWIVSAVVLYAVFVRPAQGDADTMFIMNDYYAYAGAFMPFPPTSLRELQWFPIVFWQYLDHPLGLASARLGVWYAGLAAVVLLAGTAVAAWKNRAAAFVLLGPIAVALLVSGLELYPFYQRTILWTAPIAFCMIGRALEPLFNATRVPFRIAAAVVLLLLLAAPAVRAARIAWDPSPHHELDRALHYVADHAKPGDFVFMRPGDHAAYYFMTGELPADTPPVNLLVGGMAQLEAVPAGNRVWIAAFYDSPATLQPLLATAQRRGIQHDAFHATGASAYLYSFTE